LRYAFCDLDFYRRRGSEARVTSARGLEEYCEMADGKFRLVRRAVSFQHTNRGAGGLARKELRNPSFGIQFAFTYGVKFINQGGIRMKTEIVEKTIEVRDQLGSEVKRVKEAVAGAVDNGVVAAKRAVKQGRRAAEDLVDDAEYRIKQRPFSALGVTFGVGMGLGAAIGILLARNGRNGNGK
jgi:ElaB/YqjD/DUF883 family membrane-anchored ribosome-binding protein